MENNSAGYRNSHWSAIEKKTIHTIPFAIAGPYPRTINAFSLIIDFVCNDTQFFIERH